MIPALNSYDPSLPNLRETPMRLGLSLQFAKPGSQSNGAPLERSKPGSLLENLPPASSHSADRQTAAPMAHDGRRGWPLACIGTCRSFLGLNEDRILEMLEEGALSPAWNISPTLHAHRRELRVLPEALTAFRAGGRCEMTWEQILDRITPSDDDQFSTALVSRALNCSNTSVIALISGGLLKARGARGARGWRTGPGQGAKISRESLLKFLAARRYPEPFD